LCPGHVRLCRVVQVTWGLSSAWSVSLGRLIGRLGIIPAADAEGDALDRPFLE
jgi:hypothetical protein